MKKIYKKVKQRKLRIQHVCEVGVYLPETSNVLDFIKEGIPATLVEADPGVIEKIRLFFKNDKVQLHPYAMWDYKGMLTFSQAAASTFVSQLADSPAITNDKYEIRETTSFEVPCTTFDTIDDGTIDLLSIDIEGSEWYVLKYLKSRPLVLSVETHGKYYTNPFMMEIDDWMRRNDYICWYKDGSDTVFVRRGILAPSFSDRWETWFSEANIRWKKWKRLFKKR